MNITKRGYKVHNLPLYINDKFTNEKVIYIGDLNDDKVEVVTDKTFYYEVDLHKQYVTEYDGRILINTAFNSTKYLNERWNKIYKSKRYLRDYDEDYIEGEEEEEIVCYTE